MKAAFETFLAWVFFISLAIGFFFPLARVVTALVFLVGVFLADSVLAIDNMVKNNLSSLLLDDSMLLTDEEIAKAKKILNQRF